MDSHTNNLNFDQLAQETFQLSEQLEEDFKTQTGQDRFQLLGKKLSESLSNEESQQEVELEEQEDAVEDDIPAAPGLFYWVDLGQNTFVLRAAPTRNLKETMDNLFDEDSDFLGALRIESTEDESLALLNYYETETFEMAEIIRDQLSHRRLPYKEEQICNISDPGHTWWLHLEEDKIKIYFRSYGFKDEKLLIKLGPIGDQKIAQIRFDQASEIMGSFFPISEYSCSDKGVVIGTEQPQNLHFKIFKDVFVNGEFDGQLKHFPKGKNSLTLYFYFKELAIIRKFWLQLEKSFAHLL